MQISLQIGGYGLMQWGAEEFDFIIAYHTKLPTDDSLK